MNIQQDNQNNISGSCTSSYSIPKAKYRPNELIFTRVGPLRINMEISARSKDHHPLYSIDITGLFSDNTEITLYTGSKKDEHVLGRCRFNKFRTSEMQIGLHGGGTSRMVWIKHHDYYRWSVPREPEAGYKAAVLEEKYFLWKATEQPPSLSGNRVFQNLELCDMDNDVVYAAYSGAAPGTKDGGHLPLRDDLGQDFTAMVILTLSDLIEKERQKRARKGNYTIGMLAY